MILTNAITALKSIKAQNYKLISIRTPLSVGSELFFFLLIHLLLEFSRISVIDLNMNLNFFESLKKKSSELANLNKFSHVHANYERKTIFDLKACQMSWKSFFKLFFDLLIQTESNCGNIFYAQLTEA